MDKRIDAASSQFPDQAVSPSVRSEIGDQTEPAAIDSSAFAASLDGAVTAVNQSEQASVENPTDAHVAEGNRLIRAGKPDQAIVSFRQAVSMDERRADAYEGWGRALAALGRDEQARIRFDHAIRIDPNYFDAYVQSGSVLFSMGRYGEAIERFEKSTSLNSDNIYVWIALARTFLALNNPDEALIRLERAIALDANSTEARLLAGQILLDLNRHGEALEHYDHIIESEPKSGPIRLRPALQARLNSARALLELRRYPEALQRLRVIPILVQELTKGLPENEVRDFQAVTAVAYFYAGTAYLKLKQYQQAIDLVTRAYHLQPSMSISSNYTIGAILWHQGKYSEAWSRLSDVQIAYKDVVNRNDSNLTPAELGLVASALLELGQSDQAEELYLNSIRLDDEDIEPKAGLIELYMRRRDDEPRNGNRWFWKAREVFLSARVLLEDALGADRSASNLFNMGTLYVTMEEEEGAKPYLEEALTLDPELMGAYANLGIIHARKDDHEKAAAYFSEALRRDPDNSNLRNYIAETYLRLDLPDRAEEEYRSVLQVAPCNILAHVGLGQTLSALGDKGDTDAYTQAIFHLSEAISLAQSMRAGAPQQRKGSMRLTGKQLASVFYARGYARVRAYEARAEETVFTLRGDERLLRGAADDFKQATALNPEHYRAKRAVQRIEQRRKSLSPHTLAERRAPQVFVPLSLAMLALIQTSYFFGWPADSISDANYVLLTFGLLMFVAAGFYLPQLLKLKVGAVELEKKGSFEQLTTLMPLNIAIDVFPASFVSVVAADYSSSRVTTKKPPHEPIDVHRPSSVADVEAGARWDQANSGAPK